MSEATYDVTLAAIPGDSDHHPRCPQADCEWPDPHNCRDCTCDDLIEEDDEDAAYARYEESRK
jgi:hypothetical protein